MLRLDVQRVLVRMLQLIGNPLRLWGWQGQRTSGTVSATAAYVATLHQLGIVQHVPAIACWRPIAELRAAVICSMLGPCPAALCPASDIRCVPDVTIVLCMQSLLIVSQTRIIC